jgi:hypothetical protein
LAISENSSIFAQIYTNDIIIYLLTINGIYMKKIFTLVLALMGFAGVANAATVDDIAVCKHSYVLCFDDWDNNGGAKPGKGQLFGNGFFLDVTGGSVSTGKGKVNLSVVNEADDNHVTQYIADKYGADYPDDHFNSWRLKNAQDVIAMKVTAKSKLIFFLQGNNKSGKDARIPKISKNADLSDPLNDAPDENHPTTDAGFRFEWTAPDDMLIYIGTYNGDTFFSYLIVEANEAPGTPTVKVGDQKYEGGLWFREVTCKANDMVEEGSTEKIPTVVTYTTDGSAPTAASTLYTEPIKCYKDMTIKFQAFMNFGDGKPSDDFICDGADNDANVNFKFDAPSIAVDGANVTITTPYAGQGGTNFYTLNGGSAVQGDAATLTESATVVAYTEIANGEYGKFTSSSTSKDAYVLNAIKEKKTIAVTAADVVLDEEATATSTTGDVYKVENGAISADKTDFFVKNLTFSVVKDANYQVPAGQEAYIQMSNTNITFFVAEGDSVDVKVTTTKNSCKTLNPDNDESVTTDRKNYVNVSGTTYGNDDVTAENGNIIEFGLKGAEGGSYFTFQKYSGTGNILISSIEITPAAATPAETETVLWEGTATVTGWADQPQFLSDGGAELTAAGAKAGDKIRIYASAPDTNWQFELFDGHWHNNYQRFSEVALTNEDGSPRESIIVPLSTQGYVDFAITDAFLTDVTTAAGWGGTFLLNGDGNITVTKVTLVQDGATGIQNVKVQKVQSNAIFNLAGQRVDANYKGVVIVNGKKMIQK